MSHPLYSPDRAIVADLRRIDPGLSVEWWDERWHVFHDLPHMGNVQTSAHALARETYYDFRREGRLVPHAVCLAAAYKLIDQEQLVCVVQNDDGSYRPLDARLVSHLRRLDWQRRNWWVADYLAVARRQAATLCADRARRSDALWRDLRQDITGYVDRHAHSFSATALRNMEARNGAALLASA